MMPLIGTSYTFENYRIFFNTVHVSSKYIPKGAFKYYVFKEVGGWVGQMMMFDDKVGGWEWLNDDVIKK